MAVTLINPPQLSTAHQVTNGLVPPLGPMYLSAVLKANNFPVTFIDALGEAPTHYYKYDGCTYRGLGAEEIVSRIPRDTKLVGITAMFSINYIYVIGLCRLIKEKRPGIPIVLGGAHVTALPEFVLECPYVDFICLGEAEIVFLKLCQTLERNNWTFNVDELRKLKAVGFKDGGRVYLNKDLELMKDVDGAPYPDWDSLPVENYFALKESHGSLRYDRWAIMLFSRGCPYDCSFCNTPYIWKRKWRARDPKKVVDEIVYLQNKYGVREIHFEDENMSTDLKALERFCEELIGRKIDIKWQAANGMRPDRITERLIMKMSESGCTNIVLAPESGSQRVLEEVVTKTIDLEEVLRVALTASKHKLKTSVYMMMGMPGERREDMWKSIWFLIRLAKRGIDECVVSLFVPLPGSELFNRLWKEGKIQVDDAFFRSLIAQGDLAKSKSWSEEVSDVELNFYRLLGYGMFHLTKLIFHPINVFRSVLNVLTGKQELKSERVLVTKIRKTKDYIRRALVFAPQ